MFSTNQSKFSLFSNMSQKKESLINKQCENKAYLYVKKLIQKCWYDLKTYRFMTRRIGSSVSTALTSLKWSAFAWFVLLIFLEDFDVRCQLMIMTL